MSCCRRATLPIQVGVSRSHHGRCSRGTSSIAPPRQAATRPAASAAPGRDVETKVIRWYMSQRAIRRNRLCAAQTTSASALLSLGSGAIPGTSNAGVPRLRTPGKLTANAERQERPFLKTHPAGLPDRYLPELRLARHSRISHWLPHQDRTGAYKRRIYTSAAGSPKTPKIRLRRTGRRCAK